MKKNVLNTAIGIFFIMLSLTATAQNARHSDINIINFTVMMNQNKVKINWSTDKMGSANYFEVEKSNDGKNFKTVAYVLGADPAKKDCDCYGCFDKISGSAEKSYYRLKHVDSSGLIEFSEIKMLALK
mgnify:CR=1 FL=1